MTPKLAFIGAGNIARAIIGGLVATGTDPKTMAAADPAPEQLGRLPAGVRRVAAASDAVAGADAVVLCVKPGLVKQVAIELAGSMGQGIPVISVAAGVTTQTIAAPFGPDQPVIRCMPNTPALVGAGMTGLYANEHVTGPQRDLATHVLGAVGATRWFESEDELDVVTAVSGSGPAYFFLVMEAMEAAATELGLSADVARELVLQTALGAARMARQSSEDPATLRHNVTSPGGTTEAALDELLDAGLPAAFSRALAAAHRRSRELAGSDGS